MGKKWEKLQVTAMHGELTRNIT